MCPSTNTRWCPTPEQLMILEELYRRGLRTPNATQIQKIAAHLSLYGNIQGKNVFYWFQNHKARDRQKLRKKLHHHLLHRHHLHRHPHSQFLDFQFPPLFSAHNLPFQGGDVGVMGQTWIGSDTPKDCLMRSYGHDSPTTVEVGPTWGSKPLQTLELFPLTSPSATSNDQETLSGSSSM